MENRPLAITSESRLNELLRSKLKPFTTWRFEPGLPVGVSDIHWHDGNSSLSGWIESKYEVEEVRPSQAIWLREYTGAGGRAHVVAIRHRALYVISGKHIPINRKIPWAHERMRFYGPVDEMTPGLWTNLRRQLTSGS